MKRVPTLMFRPFRVGNPLNPGGDAPASDRWPASALPFRFGFLDRRLVVPAAAAIGLADLRAIGAGLGLFVAPPAESRPAPGRELVNLGGPVIQTRIHLD